MRTPWFIAAILAMSPVSALAQSAAQDRDLCFAQRFETASAWSDLAAKEKACAAVSNNPSATKQDKSLALATLGRLADVRGDNAAALSKCEEALKLDPNNVVGLYCRANKLRDSGKLDLALQDLDQAIRLKPDYVPAIENRGDVYDKKGQFDRAIRDYDEAIRLKPDGAKAFNNRGITYRNKGQYDRAIEDFDQAIRLKPDYALAFRNRGLVYTDKGQYDRAIQDYDQAIRLKPDYAEAFNNRGVAYFRKGQYDRAIQDYDEAIRLEPDDPIIFRNRGITYRNKGQYDRAIVDFDQAIRLKPDYAEAFTDRGTAFEKKGQYDRAMQDFDQAIRLKPDDAYGFLSRGAAFHNRGQYDRAIQDYDQAIRLKPDLAQAYANRGSAYDDKGQYDRAITDYDQAIRLKPDNAYTFNNRCVANINKGQYDQAIQDCDEAIRLKPDFAIAFANRGRAYGARGDYDRAIADLEKAFARNPSLGNWAKSALADARKGKEDLAKRATAAGTGARIALVIGNSQYDHDAPLPNARRDARAIAKLLRDLGYTIYGDAEKDYRKADLEAAVETFRKAAEGADSAIVWYTGHGQKMREEGSEIADDWVIPVDAVIQNRKDIATAAVRVERLKGSVLAAKRLRLVVIDACRNSKFYTGQMGGGMKNEPAPGALIVYSAQPGNTADAGPDDGHSPFAQAFIELLPKKAKTDIRKFFADVVGRTQQLNSDQKPEPIDGLATGEDVPIVK